MKLKTTLVLFTALMLFSCSELDEPIVSSEKNDEQISETLILSEQQAVEIATDALHQFLNSEINSRTERSFSSKVSHYPSYSRSSEVKAYIVNFDEGGYAVVSANPNDPEILAINDEGSFEPVNQPSNAYFMTLADEYLANKADIDTTYIKPIIPPDIVVSDSLDNLAYIMHDGHRCGRIEKTHTLIPKFELLYTRWHQHSPYNDQCPSFYNPTKEIYENSPAGCVAIALAQILAYREKPEVYKGKEMLWSDYKTFPNVYSYHTYASDVAFLCHNIGLDVGMVYDINGSSASVTNAYNFLKNVGFTNSVLVTSYAEQQMLSNVNDRNPVIISGIRDGVGHMWIIDGAYKKMTDTTWYNLDTKKVCHTSTNYDLYFHCNWGWGWNESNGGFYLSNVFNPRTSTTSANYGNFIIIYNIF